MFQFIVPAAAALLGKKALDGKPFTNTQRIEDPGYDPNKYEYGGRPGGADAERERLQGMGSRAGYSRDYQADRASDLTARNEQSRGLGYAQEGVNASRDAMLGRGTSVADLQRQRGLQAAQNAAASTAASARGGGANMAAAQRLAAQQQSQLAGQSNEQAAMLRANEIATARGQFGQMSGQYGQMAGQMRGMDQSRAALASQNAMQRAGLQQGYEQMGQQINQTQLQAQIAGDQNRVNNSFRAQEGMAGIGDKNTDRTTQLVGAGIGMVGNMMGAAGAAASDIRAKEAIKPANSEVARSLDALNPYEYSYKEPGRFGEGRRVGIMAQDLEKSPAGAQVVESGKGGTKMIDGKKAISFNLAAAANLNDRLRKVEAATGGTTMPDTQSLMSAAAKGAVEGGAKGAKKKSIQEQLDELRAQQQGMQASAPSIGRPAMAQQMSDQYQGMAMSAPSVGLDHYRNAQVQGAIGPAEAAKYRSAMGGLDAYRPQPAQPPPAVSQRAMDMYKANELGAMSPEEEERMRMMAGR